MNGGDEDSAVFKVGPHDGGKRDLSGGVERSRRLVKQPQRALGDQEASKRHASSLARGKQPGREIDHVAQAKRRKRPELRRAGGVAAQHRGREGEVLAAVSAALTPSAWPR